MREGDVRRLSFRFSKVDLTPFVLLRVEYPGIIEVLS